LTPKQAAHVVQAALSVYIWDPGTNRVPDTATKNMLQNCYKLTNYILQEFEHKNMYI